VRWGRRNIRRRVSTTTAESSATEEPAGSAPARRYAIFNRRRKSFYLQRPDGSPLTFESLEKAESVCAALNREDPNDEEPEYRVEEVRE
jgi:hypothetical protein